MITQEMRAINELVQENKAFKQDIHNLQLSILRIQNDFTNNKNCGISVEPKYWAVFNKENNE